MSSNINIERIMLHAITRWPPIWSVKSPVSCAERLVKTLGDGDAIKNTVGVILTVNCGEAVLTATTVLSVLR